MSDATSRASADRPVPKPTGLATCPVCDSRFEAEAPSAPFCSSRCRTIDMGRWLDGRYTISRPLHQADLEE